MVSSLVNIIDVVYFDQRLGAAHAKRWLKYPFILFCRFFFELFSAFQLQINSK